MSKGERLKVGKVIQPIIIRDSGRKLEVYEFIEPDNYDEVLKYIRNRSKRK